jgi:hypothetical protein
MSAGHIAGRRLIGYRWGREVWSVIAGLLAVFMLPPARRLMR